MQQNTDPEWLVSNEQLAQLAKWFELFEFAEPHEGSLTKSKEAKWQFDSEIERLYRDVVYPAQKDNLALTLSCFTSHVRNKCRKLVASKARKQITL